MTLVSSFQRAYVPRVTPPASERKRRSLVAHVLGFVAGVLAGRTVSFWGRVRPLLLSVAALGLATYGAFTLSTWWGCLAGAVSILVLEWRVAEE